MSIYTLHHGDCLDVLRAMPDASVDAVVTDPPYAEVDRPYGRLTEPDWHALMRGVTRECRRILKPTGSAVFILQPNSERVGRMRPWLFEFMAEQARDWNMIQDAWWWNFTSPPTVHCHVEYGLMRPSLKACVWLGEPTCYRAQERVLVASSPSHTAMIARVSGEGRAKRPSGVSMDEATFSAAAARGGATPFNVLPMSNTNSRTSGGALGHGAATPLPLCSWWVRYLCPPGGVVLDPFTGSGTTGVACAAEGFQFVGIEREAEYIAIAERRIAEAHRQGKLDL